MKKWFNHFYKDNKPIVWALGLAIILSLGILWKVRDEVTRFTLIMPIFAGFILFSILITPDEDLEDKQTASPGQNKKPATKKTSRKK